MSDDRRRFRRPWEAPDEEGTGEEGAEVFTLPMSEDVYDFEEDHPEPIEVDRGQWEEVVDTPSAIEGYTSDEYLSATTEEYKGLAEEVSRAAEEEWEQQAVAATMPGVGSGLVGFEDVTGTAGVTEEEVEADEQAASSDLAMRVGSGLAIFGMFLGSLLLGGWWFAGFVILAMVVAAGEFYANVRTVGIKPLALTGLLGVVAMGVAGRTAGAPAMAAWAAVFAVVTILFFSLSSRRSPLEDAAVTVVGMAWVGMLSFAAIIATGPHPVAHILFIVFLVAANDIGAYFVGRSMGRRPLAPVISPHKTVEGLIGGVILALVVSSILATFPAWEAIGIARAMVGAVVIALVAVAGDAAESMVKRALGVKDMGSVLPGHGGMLDRVDGFLFVLPVVYFLFRGFGLL